MKDVHLQAKYTQQMNNGVEEVLSPFYNTRPETERDAKHFTSWIAFVSPLI